MQRLSVFIQSEPNNEKFCLEKFARHSARKRLTFYPDNFLAQREMVAKTYNHRQAILRLATSPA